MSLQDLIQDLKRKKELQDIDNNFIEARIKQYLRDRTIPHNKKSKEYKKIFKDLRRLLRKVYGMFRVVEEKRDLNFYNFIFNKIKPKKVLDLGCGKEPLYYTNKFDLEFYATDISKNIVKEIDLHFKKYNIKGKAFVFNLIEQDLSRLPKVDVCLMLKLLESLEFIKKDISKELLKKIKARYFVVSFAKQALSKKVKIKKAGRSWFRRILRELNYGYKVIDYKDEIVFIIRKQ